MNLLPLGRFDDGSVGPVDAPGAISWEIDWRGQRARLHVPQPAGALRLRVLVDGEQVAILAIPRGPRAHSEFVLSGSSPKVVVGLGVVTEASTAIGVFADGVEVNTRLTLEQWRAPFDEKPDRFAEMWHPIVAQGWRYPLLFAAVGASPLLVMALGHRSASLLAWWLAAFLVAVVYAVGLVGLLRWLSFRPN
jgi:hypothetical protein